MAIHNYVRKLNEFEKKATHEKVNSSRNPTEEVHGMVNNEHKLNAHPFIFRLLIYDSSTQKINVATVRIAHIPYVSHPLFLLLFTPLSFAPFRLPLLSQLLQSQLLLFLQLKFSLHKNICVGLITEVVVSRAKRNRTIADVASPDFLALLLLPL